MIRMSDVWDRTTQVLRGRASMLASIAFLLSFLPQVVQSALIAFFANRSPGYYATLTAVVFAVVMLAIWGRLALVAAASDPATDRRQALATGGARLPAAIGLSALTLLAVSVLVTPMLVLIGSSGLHLAALSRPGSQPDFTGVSPGAIGGAALYFVFVLLPVAFWVGARLAVFTPVLVNERLGMDTFARSWRLTRGLAWRIIGVFLLFIVVYGVVASAAQFVITLLFRLLLGYQGSGTALFLGTTCTAAIAAAFVMVTSTFTAQLYRTLTGREAAETFA